MGYIQLNIEKILQKKTPFIVKQKSSVRIPSGELQQYTKAMLTLAECLREARSLQIFNGSSECTLSNFLRDASTVLSLTPPEHVGTIQSVLANRLQGKALCAVESLVNPTWEQTIQRLREEFGVKQSFINLRNEAMNISALKIEELHYKLRKILYLMNTKYFLEGS